MEKMDTLDLLLFQLEQYGEEHDRNKKTREEKLRNIT
ncbi:methyltransferase, partial [Bacillus cereus]|nr:methyltransferase [Bacillus cereus]